jgi:hypothetical protein
MAILILTTDEEISLHQQAPGLRDVLLDLNEHLRQECKYINNEAACEIREKLYEYIRDYNVNLDIL